MCLLICELVVHLMNHRILDKNRFIHIYVQMNVMHTEKKFNVCQLKVRNFNSDSVVTSFIWLLQLTITNPPIFIKIEYVLLIRNVFFSAALSHV